MTSLRDVVMDLARGRKGENMNAGLTWTAEMWQQYERTMVAVAQAARLGMLRPDCLAMVSEELLGFVMWSHRVNGVIVPADASLFTADLRDGTHWLVVEVFTETQTGMVFTLYLWPLRERPRSSFGEIVRDAEAFRGTFEERWYDLHKDWPLMCAVLPPALGDRLRDARVEYRGNVDQWGHFRKPGASSPNEEDLRR